MKQHLTIRPGFWKKILENEFLFTSPIDSIRLDIVSFIIQNIICTSNNDQKRLYISEYEKLPDEKKARIKDLVTKILDPFFWNTIEVPTDRTQDEFLAVCRATDDKILLSEQKEEATDIEVHNLESFVQPTYYQKLKHLPTVISLEIDTRYDLGLILEPFVRGAKNLEILDHYFSDYGCIINIKKILDVAKNLTHLTFFVLGKDRYTSNKCLKPEEMEKMRNEVCKLEKIYNLVKFDIIYLDENKKHLERAMFTDEVLIRTPGSMNFLDKDGYLRTKSDRIAEPMEITIKKRISREQP